MRYQFQMKKLFISCFWICFLSLPIYGQFDLYAQVVRVTDGDTITIQAGNLEFRVRLHGIDAPDLRQPMGTEARLMLQRLLGVGTGRISDPPTVRLMVTDIDRFGRIIARVFVEDQEVNLSLLELGYAWHYLEFDQSQDYVRAQEIAQRTRLGLWAEDDPIAPWEWRRR
jgi:micrococcal nuclease